MPEEYQQTDADDRYDRYLQLLRAALPEAEHLILELDNVVGERLVESHHAGYELARQTLDAVGYRAADELAHGWRFQLTE